MTAFPPKRAAEGFTLVELLVVVAIIAILASLLFPTLARAKDQAHRMKCLNNQKQLALTWVLYSTDNSDVLVPNGAGQTGIGPASGSLWVAGDYHNFVPAFTNDLYVLDPRYAAFGRYLKTRHVYKCPSDRTSFIAAAGQPVPQVRSYSLNLYLGPTSSMDQRISARYRVFRKSSDIRAAASTFLFQDLAPQSLCTPAFIVLMPGMATDQFFHLPATHHNRGGVVSFTDGHAEAHRWRDPRTLQTASLGQRIGHNLVAPRSQDLAWIYERTSVLR